MPNLRIDSGVAAVALSGEPEIGDGRVIVARPNGLLVAAMDGLGHGPQAALASRRAAAVLQRHPEAPLMELMQLCHTELRGTRGAVMSLAAFNLAAESMEWLGVGNVAGVFLGRDGNGHRLPRFLTLRAGVIGDSLPHLVIETLPVAAGDTLVLATDGILPAFAAGGLPESDLISAQRLASQILLRSARGNDDALVLVAHCLVGAGPAAGD